MLRKLLPPIFAAATAVASSAAELQMIPFKDADGNNRNLKEFAGQVVLIVNVASKCGFTRQYGGLEALYQKYKDQGFMILAFPCNDFGGQEPGSIAEIRDFCSTTFRVTFPVMDKIEIRGEGRHPLYKAMPGAVRWNFAKHLIGRDGSHIGFFGSLTKPDSDEMNAAIEKALAAPKP